jgi:hypothetical protein
MFWAYSLEFNFRGESEVEKNTGSTMRANDNLCNQGTPCDTERALSAETFVNIADYFVSWTVHSLIMRKITNKMH